MDVTRRDFSVGPSVGRPPTGGPPGLGSKPPSSQVGVALPTPGCSGLQLSRYRLEQLRKHLRLPSSRSHTEPATAYPGVPQSSGLDRPLGPCDPLVSVSAAALMGSPPPQNRPISVLRGRPGLPLVGDLRQMTAFLF